MPIHNFCTTESFSKVGRCALPLLPNFYETDPRSNPSSALLFNCHCFLLQVHFFGGSETSFCGRSHVDIALESKELEICPYSSSAYYLFGRLAQLELDLSEKAQNFLLDAGLDMMACPGKGGTHK